jgi:hypothetical protein
MKRVVHQQPITSVHGPTPASSFISSQEIVYVSPSSLSSKQDNEMDGNDPVIPCTLSNRDIKIDTHALVDCGCTRLSFMNEAFACQHNFPHYQLKIPKTVEVIDGRPISSGDITEYVEVQYTIGDHYKTLTAYLTSLGHYHLILGISWLKRHDITIHFAKNDIYFSSPGYLPYCAMVTPVPIKGLIPERRYKIPAISTMTF